MAIHDIYQAVLGFDIAGVKSLTQKEIDAGTAVDAILNEGLIAPMDEVGEKFSAGELFVPEMLMAAKAMKFGIGGAPVTEAFSDQIGADGFSADAPGAVEIARRLMAA
jgi:methanogenic corrinoid protein MtbC1